MVGSRAANQPLNFTAAKRKINMPIKTSIDEILTATEKKSIQEYKGKARITDVTEYKSQQSGKTSIKVEFDVDGAKFSAYSGLTDASVKITISKIVSILYASVGKEKTKQIFNEVANSEDVDTEAQLASELAHEASKKLKKNEVFAEVDRSIAEKGEDGKVKRYNIKWFVPDAEKEAKKDDMDSFLDSVDND